MMNSKNDNRIDERMSKLLRSGAGKSVPPDEAFLARLRRESTEVFMAASGAGRARPGRYRIMQKSLLKWVVPAAAVAAVLAAVGIWQGDNGGGRVYGMTDVPELLSSGRTLHMQGLMYLPPCVPPGQKQTEVAYEMWADLEGVRLRQTRYSYTVAPGGVEVTQGETVSDGRYRMRVDHSDKSAVFERLNDFHRTLQFQRSVNGFYTRLHGRLEQLGEYAKTGRQQIDGLSFDTWEAVFDEPLVGMSYKAKWWLAPDSGEIARIHVWMRFAGAEDWCNTLRMDTIERNVTAPPGTFDTTAPAGYTLINSKETAEVPELRYEGGCGLGSLSCTARISFVLADGSVLLGWSSGDTRATSSQDGLFQDLQIGGPLPKLPMEIYGLTKTSKEGVVSYVGRHLAHTRKGDQYHEWSLYVPERKMEPSSNTYYQVLHRFNVESEVMGSVAMNVSGPFLVGAEDFDALVRGAMAELSDSGVAPAHVTHEGVMRLIGEIRASLGDAASPSQG